MAAEGGVPDEVLVPKVSHVTTDPERDFLIVHLTEKLQAGWRVRFSINYTATLGTDFDGLYGIRYFDDNGIMR